ncbi:MAG: serine/threonine-protein kinase [Sorangiineae bacterium]|nr:serine/threonine-protein kinase [Polyangiaceae bacterium]MEB2323907.1 serine/threonine-protein kinase [Sorangiineae bacterium]
MTSSEAPPSSATAALAPGAQLGPYRLLAAVAQGGMARVWAAQDRAGTVVAIKTIRPELAEDATYRALFADEARFASSVAHPNVCRVYGLGEDRGVLYIAMEWVRGESFARILKPLKGEPVRPVAARHAAKLIADGCAALHATHELRDRDGRTVRLVHCDVSPQNLLLTVTGQVKLVDFGVARATAGTSSPPPSLRAGKAAYMAPEQAVGRRVSRLSDVFVLGACLYELTTGRRPFATGSWEGTIERLTHGDFATPRELDPDYPELLERVVLRAMASSDALRYPSAERMRVALEDYLRRSGPPLDASDLATFLDERAGALVRERDDAIQRALGYG